MKQDEARTEEKQEKVLRVEEANKTEEEQLSHPQKEEKEFNKKTIRIIHLQRRRSS